MRRFAACPVRQPSRQLRQLTIQMCQSGAQRIVSPIVRGCLQLVDDAAAGELQAFPFLTALDLVDVDVLPLAARRALLLGVLPVGLNCFAFESSCHNG
jgi:hypothetical protein